MAFQHPENTQSIPDFSVSKTIKKPTEFSPSQVESGCKEVAKRCKSQKGPGNHGWWLPKSLVDFGWNSPGLFGTATASSVGWDQTQHLPSARVERHLAPIRPGRLEPPASQRPADGRRHRPSHQKRRRSRKVKWPQIFSQFRLKETEQNILLWWIYPFGRSP